MHSFLNTAVFGCASGVPSASQATGLSGVRQSRTQEKEGAALFSVSWSVNKGLGVDPNRNAPCTVLHNCALLLTLLEPSCLI